MAQFRLEMRLLAETARLWLRLPQKVCLMAVAVAARVILFSYALTLTSALIQIGLALPMVIYFHRVSFTGLSANAVIVPLLGLALPVGFLAVFTGWSVPARIAGWLLTVSQSAAQWHAQMEPNWRIADPPLWLAAGVAAALVAVAFAARLPGGTRWRVVRTAAILVAAALLGLMVWHPFPPEVKAHELEITAIDVGQGDSIFVALPNGKLMLMDAGGMSSFGGKRIQTNLDIGEDVVSPYLWSRPIRRLDVVALSHAHEDHIGGMPAFWRIFTWRSCGRGRLRKARRGKP